MEVASIVVHHISDQKSQRSIELENIDASSNQIMPSINNVSISSWLFPRLGSFSFIGLLIYWILTEQNGFSSSKPSMVDPAMNATANGYLGYHALGLSLWAVVAMQETIMAYGIPLCCKSTYTVRKWMHIGSQALGFLLGAGGMTAILWYKNSSVNIPVGGTEFTIMEHPYYIPYSPHAWLGIVFFLTWMVQCLGRLFPTFMTLARHRFLGRFLYMTGIACCALGLQQQQTRQLMITVTAMANNSTLSMPLVHASTWWFSQPSLGVILLGLTSAATFYFGLI